MSGWPDAVRDPARRFVGLWADGAAAYALVAADAGPEVLSCAIADDGYPALSPLRPAAAPFEQAVRELWAAQARGAADAPAVLDHGRWPVSAPLSARPGAPPRERDDEAEEPSGAALQNAGIGPAGAPTPAHINLSLVGETVVAARARGGFAHRGVLALLRGKSPRAAARFAVRLSGDAAVAHAIAFARAAEAAAGIRPPPRAEALRAVMAEIERADVLLDMLGQLGATIGEDHVVVRAAPARTALRDAAAGAFGHRLMFDAIEPGGLASEPEPGRIEAMRPALATAAAAIEAVQRVITGGRWRDRLEGIGTLTSAQIVAAEADGMIARASGLSRDARRWPGMSPYDQVPPFPAAPRAVPCDARLRGERMAAEAADAVAIAARLLAELPVACGIGAPMSQATGEGLGWAEAPTGEAWCWLRLDQGQITAAFLRDPAWMQWSLLGPALRGASVANARTIIASLGPRAPGADL